MSCAHFSIYMILQYKINVKISVPSAHSIISSKLALKTYSLIWRHHFQRSICPAQDSLYFKEEKTTHANFMQRDITERTLGNYCYQSEGQEVLQCFMRIWTLARFMIWLVLHTDYDILCKYLFQSFYEKDHVTSIMLGT